MGDHVIIAINGQIWHNVECDDAGQLLQEKNGATGAFRMEYKPPGDGVGGVMGFLNMLGQSVTETSRQQTARRRAELQQDAAQTTTAEATADDPGVPGHTHTPGADCPACLAEGPIVRRPDEGETDSPADPAADWQPSP